MNGYVCQMTGRRYYRCDQCGYIDYSGYYNPEELPPQCPECKDAIRAAAEAEGES